MSVPSPVPEYGWLTALALFGSIARAKQWQDLSGKLLVWKCVTEVSTALVLAAICVGAGSWWNVSEPVIAGMSALAGLVGPAAVVTFLTEKLGIKLS